MLLICKLLYTLYMIFPSASLVYKLKLLVRGTCNGLLHHKHRVDLSIVLQENLEQVFTESRHHSHALLVLHNRCTPGISQVPENNLGWMISIASFLELVADDHVVCGFPIAADLSLGGLVKFHIAEDEQTLDHLLGRERVQHRLTEDDVEAIVSPFTKCSCGCELKVMM